MKKIFVEKQKIWEENINIVGEATKIDTSVEIRKAELKCKSDSRKHLKKEMFLIEETINFLYCLSLTAHTIFKRTRNKSDNLGVFLFLTLRSCHQLLAIKKLVSSGFEDSARIITRALIETLDILIVSLVDEQFAKSYTNEPEEKFWNNNIANGKIKKLLDKTIDIAKLDEEFKNEFYSQRSILKNLFSGSVHSALFSTINSVYTSSLEDSEVLEKACFGVIGKRASELLLTVVDLVYLYNFIIISISLSDEPQVWFTKLKLKRFKFYARSFAGNFFTYQDIIQKFLYNNQIKQECHPWQ
jgi:hypothetical protein